jgi:hypothetical protein
MGAPILAILLAVASSTTTPQAAPASTDVAPAQAVTAQPVRAAQPVVRATNDANAGYGSTDKDVHIPPVDISGAFEAKMLELSG